MKSNLNQYLWVHGTDVQDMFNLHPLEVESIIHHNLPSKIEKYEKYIFAIIDCIKDESNASYSNQGRCNSQNYENKIKKT